MKDRKCRKLAKKIADAICGEDHVTRIALKSKVGEGKTATEIDMGGLCREALVDCIYGSIK